MYEQEKIEKTHRDKVKGLITKVGLSEELVRILGIEVMMKRN